ncbi:hypothetical protein KIN20_015549 [Parelaphostrongylus tenuis]|uniref:Cytochrome P450 n=1 Tax=Parelaphostrongylus tenuis TaxID=148309 RepID=A0AAD5N0S9_PARTN|nr:hypothetical protein KIN20_015549 [Parelaphostrongylus tenuis]
MQSEDEMKFASILINRKELNVRDLKIILLSMFSDGLSTTATMLIYNLFNIVRHPDIQDELRSEVNSVVGRLEGPPLYSRNRLVSIQSGGCVPLIGKNSIHSHFFYLVLGQECAPVDVLLNRIFRWHCVDSSNIFELHIIMHQSNKYMKLCCCRKGVAIFTSRHCSTLFLFVTGSPMNKFCGQL